VILYPADAFHSGLLVKWEPVWA